MAVMRVNYIRHLNAFFAQVRKDERLRANHISLYLALFQVWNQYHFQNPFPILREEVMRLSGIGSRSTYLQCLKQLQMFQYIVYQPTRQPYSPSLIEISRLTNCTEALAATQLLLFQELKVGDILLEPDNMWTKSEPRTRLKNGPRQGPKMGHIINKHINNKKRERKNALPLSKKSHKNEVKNIAINAAVLYQTATASVPPAPPSLPQVQQFFQAVGYPEVEARKFFHHYQANGWRQGGRTLIQDWQAAAHKWMLNIHAKITTHDNRIIQSTLRPGKLHTNENKSYSDPL